MKKTETHIRFLTILGLALIITSVRGDDSTGAAYNLTALNEMKGVELVEQYEIKYAESPENVGYRLNLALMYALSSVLDRSLATDEANRRKEQAVQLVEPEFRKELSSNAPDKERALYMGFILAQIHLTLSDTGKCESVFSSIATRFPGDSDVKAALTNAKKELKARMARGYPHDVKNNPWDQDAQGEAESSGESESPQ